MDVNQVVAKLIGYLVMMGSVGLKMPQIVNILSSRTVEGLSVTAIYSEAAISIGTVTYNILQKNPFSSYGESVFILVQNIILVVLLWIFQKPPAKLSSMLIITVVFLIAVIICLNLPTQFQFILPLMSLPLQVTGSASQVVQNFKNKSTGQLSLITVLLTFVGCCLRVFTTITEVGYDLPLLSGFVLGVLLSGILIFQVYFGFLSFFFPQ